MQHRLAWKRKTLPNGLRILLYPKPQANTAQLSVAVEYGSNHDPNDKAGRAHFVEHMLAGGSPKRIQTSREVEHIGGLSDFYTDLEYTMSQFSIMPEKLADATRIMANLLFNLPFEKPQFTTEQKIILTELDEVADDPYAKTDEMLLKSLYKTHPVRNPVGGFRKTVTKLTPTDIADAYERHYAPQNMILILTGNFAEADVEEQLRGFDCNDNNKVGAKTENPAEHRKPTKQLVREKAGICQSYMSLGARTVPSRHPDAAVLNLIDTLLGEGASSRLFIELREQRALTYDIRSSHDYGVDFGYFSVDCAVKERNIVKVQNLIRRELAKLRTEKVSRAELEKGKNIILGDIYRIMDSSRSCADALAFMEIQFHSENALVDYIERINAVTADGVMRVAETYLAEDRFATVVLKPKK
jgi:predicted Zn-dependent peptidase